MAKLDPLVDAVVVTMKGALAPVLERLAMAETRLSQLHTEALDLRALGERVATLETRPPVPGPPGPPGKDGADGHPGKDGTPGLRFAGVYVEGTSYEHGDLVTWAGSSWHCNDATTSKPGEGSKAWTLMVKRGRDGKGA
jgi:hypothetical protein